MCRDFTSYSKLPIVLMALVYLSACSSDESSPESTTGTDSDVTALGDTTGSDGLPDIGSPDSHSIDGSDGTPDTAASVDMSSPPDSETSDVDNDSVDTGGMDAPDVPTTPPPTWHGAVRNILKTRCADCHTSGSVAPFVLDDYATAKQMMAAGLAAIDAGTMPPWQPSDDCHPLVDVRHIPDDEVDLLRAWNQAGGPEGDPAEWIPPEATGQPVNFEATHVATLPEPYEPNPDAPDDYRCFVLDIEFEQDTYLTGARVVPDRIELVHHVLVYTIEPNMVEAVLAADAAEEGPGYTCFGAPFAGSDSLADGGVSKLTEIANGEFGLPQTIGTWVPGNVTKLAPDGVAKRLEAGSRIVMQVHYNLLGGEPVADQSTFEMVLTQDEPETLTLTTPLPVLGLSIPAGDPDRKETMIFRNYNDHPLTVIGASAHMHLLGKAFHAEVVREDESQECLLDIPNWDFAWQQGYSFPSDQTFTVAPGEGFEVSCRWDNSASNQPFVNGEQLEPVDITWGEGTLDEMCMLYLELAKPFEAPPPKTGKACSTASECVAACGENPSLDCIFGCQQADLQCNACTIKSLFSCGLPCAAHAIPLTDCFTSCMQQTAVLGGRVGACFETECDAPYQAMLECMDPLVQSGQCDGALNKCGVSFPTE